jgi:pantetheine-phosphate adenylyltransferase
MTRRAVYAGSFDPPTIGHLDIIERAAALYDHLIVGVGVNTDKTPFLPTQQRVEALKECTQHLPHVEVRAFDGLLVEFAREQNCRVLVRGLRAVSDFDFEFRVALANRRLAPEIETVFLLTREEHSFLASSVVKEIARLGGDYRQFVPSAVARLIEARSSST